MSLRELCLNALQVPLSQHQGWRGSLLFLQALCLCIYVATTILHRKRLFCTPSNRKWDLDHVFMTLSVAAAATGVVTWAFWTETNFANVRSVFEVSSAAAVCCFCDYLTPLRTRVKCCYELMVIRRHLILTSINIRLQVRAQAANEINDPQKFAREKGSAWFDNAIYLIFKPVSIGLCVLAHYSTQHGHWHRNSST